MENQTVEIIEKPKKKYMTFKERYQNEEYRQKFLENMRQPVHCEICDISFHKSGKNKHQKTKKHQINELKLTVQKLMNEQTKTQ